MSEGNAIQWDKFDDVLEAKDIAAILKISKRRVYELFQLSPEHGGIPNYNIGSMTIRADKEDVRRWTDNLKKNKSKSYVKGVG
ncbi:helix-turn-helix domain-containing protein [Neobacillus mesonae]|nr:helix-turn-helix domain-containing protein [Neobacillus mesonae]